MAPKNVTWPCGRRCLSSDGEVDGGLGRSWSAGTTARVGQLCEILPCYLSQHHHHRGDSVRTSDPENRHPLVPDDRGEHDEASSVVPPQAQESLASMLSLSGDESGNEGKLADVAPSKQPSTSQNQVNLFAQHRWSSTSLRYR